MTKLFPALVVRETEVWSLDAAGGRGEAAPCFHVFKPQNTNSQYE